MSSSLRPTGSFPSSRDGTTGASSWSGRPDPPPRAPRRDRAAPLPLPGGRPPDPARRARGCARGAIADRSDWEEPRSESRLGLGSPAACLFAALAIPVAAALPEAPPSPARVVFATSVDSPLQARKTSLVVDLLRRFGGPFAGAPFHIVVDTVPEQTEALWKRPGVTARGSPSSRSGNSSGRSRRAPASLRSSRHEMPRSRAARSHPRTRSSRSTRRSSTPMGTSSRAGV